MLRLACITTLVALALPTSALAGQSWEDVSSQTAIRAMDASLPASGGFSAFHQFPIRPDVAAPAFLMNFVSAGPGQTGVPCFGCVPTAQNPADTMGITAAYSYVYAGTVWQYVMSFSDVSYTGNCKLVWAITAGKKVLDSFNVTTTGLKPGYTILYGFNRNRPAYSGNALLTGRVTCGTAGTKSLKLPIYFQ